MTDEQALSTVRALFPDRLVTLNRSGEPVADRSHAACNAEAYRSLLRRLAEPGLAKAVDVSIRASEMGGDQAFDGEMIALDNLRLICRTAADVGATVTVEMEDHSTTDRTISIVQDLRMDYPWAGAVLQARLRRTRADCGELAYTGSRVRLCKGAYKEPVSVAYHDWREVDASYVQCLKALLETQSHPMVATHDHRLIETARRLARIDERAPVDLEFQILRTAHPSLQRHLAGQCLRTRVYLAGGTRGLPGLQRGPSVPSRSTERPDTTSPAAGTLPRDASAAALPTPPR
ncbi:proline dehydrogenase family protein [Spirillospora sp. NPDC047418]|jgi:proline dehydrogenase